ncbi:unnamed protein product, partial [marine sediment metagenome]
ECCPLLSFTVKQLLVAILLADTDDRRQIVSPRQVKDEGLPKDT